MLTQPSDEHLIESAARGDTKAFEALYRRHRGYVLAVAARFGASGQDGLDILQETFLYFFRKLPGFELRSRFRTFLYPVAKHLALKRSQQGRAQLSIEEANEQVRGLAAPNGEARQRMKVAEIVAELPPTQREVVTLRFVDGFSLGEIAEALEVPLGTVKSRLHNALVALREAEE